MSSIDTNGIGNWISDRRRRQDRTDPEGGIPGRTTHTDAADIEARLAETIQATRAVKGNSRPPPQPPATYGASAHTPGRRLADADGWVADFVRQTDEMYRMTTEEIADCDAQIKALQERRFALVAEAEGLAARRDAAEAMKPTNRQDEKRASEAPREPEGTSGRPTAAHCGGENCRWIVGRCNAPDCPWLDMEATPP